MRSRYKISDASNVYFITITTHCWVPIIFNQKICDIILDSFKFCQENKGLIILGYVIMLNHLHAIIAHREADQIPGVIRDFKRHTSTKISEYLKSLGKFSRLFWISIFHSKQKNKVWQEGYHPEAIFSEPFFLTKLNYIHNNPVEKGFVERPEHWKHSSARNYVLDDHSLFKLDLDFLC